MAAYPFPTKLKNKKKAAFRVAQQELQGRTREELAAILVDSNQTPILRYCAAKRLRLELVSEQWNRQNLTYAHFRYEEPGYPQFDLKIFGERG